ncbi:MAG TPA: DUF2182 domain-containing protein [Candidatus Limnocylindrales bacterium]|jgi:predicted metal-binding membrane protein
MTAVAPAAPLRRFTRYRRWAPEWWLLAPIAAAWVVMAGHAVADVAATGASAGPGAIQPARALLVCLVPSVGATGRGALEAAAMTVAMMLPLALPVVRHVALNSLRRRQQRAMVLFLAAFLVPTVAAGILASGALAAAPGDRRAWIVVALLIAAAYQLSRPKRRAIADCRRLVPLPPDGRLADVADLRFGLEAAWRCLRASWALMLPVTMLGSGGLIVAAMATSLLLAEDPGRLGLRVLAPSAAVLATAAVMVAVGVSVAVVP